jgi:hypothetical protein
MTLLRLLAPFAASLAFFSTASAHEYRLGELLISHPHARPTMPGQTNGAAYLGVTNNGNTADKLVGVSSAESASTELHVTSSDKNMMKMREAESLEIAPGATVTMEPGSGYHIMLTGLKQPLQPGEKFPMTLTFEKAGKIDVAVVVDQPAREAEPSSSGGDSR